MRATDSHFAGHLQTKDPLVFEALENERRRQESTIELIAPANAVSLACLEALGSPIMNKSVEGYPGTRFHGGAKFVDVVEQAAIDRAKRLFECSYANVQPHSGTQANQAIFFALLKPGDRVLSMDLAAGGHLSHGARPNQSGRWFDVAHYYVDRRTEMLNYDEIESSAVLHRPALIIAGGSAYPRVIDFQRMRQIADRVGAYYLVDMAHIAGLVAAGAHPSPVPFADIVTCTLTKTLRGPPGGIILSNRDDLTKKLQSAVFPGVQGSFHSQDVAAKAVCLGEALQPAFKEYGHQVVENARALAASLRGNGVRIVSGDTDTHLVLADVSSKGLSGQQAEDLLGSANMTSNKNPIPFGSPKPSEWAGLRLGSPAGTTRGFGRNEYTQIGRMIATLFDAARSGTGERTISEIKAKVSEMCAAYPLYR
jgi:glycine hydroxymethyltransferase